MLEGGQIQAVDDRGAAPLGDDETRVAQHVEVTGQRGLREGEAVRQLTGGHVAAPQQPQDLAPGGVTESSKHFVHATLLRLFANDRTKICASTVAVEWSCAAPGLTESSGFASGSRSASSSGSCRSIRLSYARGGRRSRRQGPQSASPIFLRNAPHRGS